MSLGPHLRVVIASTGLTAFAVSLLLCEELYAQVRNQDDYFYAKDNTHGRFSFLSYLVVHPNR